VITRMTACGDFPPGAEGLPPGGGRVVAGVGFIAHPQVGAQHVHAGLPLLRLVISQPGHRNHAVSRAVGEMWR
jgi:hypothetical protein